MCTPVPAGVNPFHPEPAPTDAGGWKGTAMTQEHTDPAEEAETDEPTPESTEEPDADELDEPSTEKDPGEEPTGGTSEPGPRDPGADHRAVGIGVIDAPLVDPQAEG